jgi:hypothetical protein
VGELISSDGAAPSSEPSRRSARGALQKSYIEVSDDEKSADTDEINEDEDEDEEMPDAEESAEEEEEESKVGIKPVASSPQMTTSTPQHRSPPKKRTSSTPKKANGTTPAKPANGATPMKKTNGTTSPKKTNGTTPATKTKATPASVASSRPSRTQKKEAVYDLQDSDQAPEAESDEEPEAPAATKSKGKAKSKPAPPKAKAAAKTKAAAAPVAKSNGKATRGAKKGKADVSALWDVPDSEED